MNRLRELSRDLDMRVGAGLFALAFLSLAFTEKDVGFTRDESVYFFASENHARWLTSPSFDDAAITHAYDFNHEHPALVKNLSGLSFVLLHEKLNLLRPAAAFRVPPWLMASMLASLIYAFTRRLFGRPAAVFAAVSWFLVPRQFFNSHLECFDVPIAAMWALVIYCYYRAHDTRWGWLWTGITFGLAIATKHNALFLPFVLIPFALVKAWLSSRGKDEARNLVFSLVGAYGAVAVLYGLLFLALGVVKFQGQFVALSPHTLLFALLGFATWAILSRLHTVDLETFRTVAPIGAMAVLGPVIWYLHWPYLWHAPVDRTAWYLQFHATHNHYAWFYLGEVLREPPFPLDYVVRVTAMTVPTAIFFPMVLGWCRSVWRMVRLRTDLLELLVLANSVWAIAIISQPSVPHFGGVKHWFPSMPFLAVLGAGALWRASEGAAAFITERFKRAVKTEQIFAGLASLCGVSALIATMHLFAFGTSAYSELAGGLPGAASLGMQRQFWSNNLTGVLDWINANARPGDRIYFHECHGGQIHDYQRNGMLRTDIRPVNGPDGADIVAYQYHQEFRDQEFLAWDALGTHHPVTGLYLDETPQVVVYRRGE
ncbi:MAG: glycosyltransferase family 39 protein [Myxococcaceae bacterium]